MKLVSFNKRKFVAYAIFSVKLVTRLLLLLLYLTNSFLFTNDLPAAGSVINSDLVKPASLAASRVSRFCI